MHENGSLTNDVGVMAYNL